MINTPSENPNIPENLKKAIENSRNVITINEVEAQRLGQLSRSLEYTIGEQNKEILEKKGFIEELSKKLTDLSDKIMANSSKIDLQGGVIKENEEILRSLKTTQETINLELLEREKKIQNEEERLSILGKELKVMESSIEEREEILNNKERKLKDFIKEL
jgi:chromosome segregation ATPase